MQTQAVDGMSWNSRYFEWQEGWKSDGWKQMWFDQTSDGACGGHYDAYGSWQPGQSGTQGYPDCGNTTPMTSSCGNGGAGGVSGSPGHMYGVVDHEVHDAAAMMGDLNLEGHHMVNGHDMSGGMGGNMTSSMGSTVHVQQPQKWFSSTETEQEKPPTRWFAALEAAQEKQPTRWFTPEADQQEKPMTSWFRNLNSDTEQDHQAMADFEESLAGMEPTPPADSSADTSGDEVERSREVTAEEREEAERVVRTAFKEAKERDRLREKVKKASGNDLQAILNARLNKKPAK